MSDNEIKTHGQLPGKAELMEILKPICDPELHISLVDLGLIYKVDVKPEEKKATVDMSLTSPGCPAANEILRNVKGAVEKTGYEDVLVQLVWEPRWDPHTMASEEAKDKLGIW